MIVRFYLLTIFMKTGSIAIPGACLGIFLGGCFLKRFELKPKGAVQFVLISNLICLLCYGLLFFLGCDNLKMAGTTIPYYNRYGMVARRFSHFLFFSIQNRYLTLISWLLFSVCVIIFSARHIQHWSHFK